MRLVVKIGGSLSIGENGPKPEYFRELFPVLNQIKHNQAIISIGGGALVRKYFNSVKEFLSNEQMEWIAVDLFRANVRFLSYNIDKPPLFSLEELNEKSEGVIGAIKPGRSSDANAAHAAKIIRADYFIKMTNVDGIYEKDPAIFPDSKMLRTLKFEDLLDYSQPGSPGNYGILDKTAMQIIIDNKIKTAIINGKNPENLLRFLEGEEIGTVISD